MTTAAISGRCSSPRVVTRMPANRSTAFASVQCNGVPSVQARRSACKEQQTHASAERAQSPCVRPERDPRERSARATHAAARAARVEAGELEGGFAARRLQQPLLVQLAAGGAADLAARRLQHACAAAREPPRRPDRQACSMRELADPCAQRVARRRRRFRASPPRTTTRSVPLAWIRRRRRRRRSPCARPADRRPPPPDRTDECCGRPG